MSWELLLGPLTGFAIGYCANRLAVKMIFWPYAEVRVFGRRIPFTPGMFVARRHVFAEVFAQALVDRFCGPKDVIRGLGQALDAGLEDKIRSRLPPVIFSILWNRLNALTAEDVRVFGAEVSAFIGESQIVSKLVTTNIAAMSPAEIERMVRSVCGRELRSMAFADAGLGCSVGCVQALVTFLLST